MSSIPLTASLKLILLTYKTLSSTIRVRQKIHSIKSPLSNLYTQDTTRNVPTNQPTGNHQLCTRCARDTRLDIVKCTKD